MTIPLPLRRPRLSTRPRAPHPTTPASAAMTAPELARYIGDFSEKALLLIDDARYGEFSQVVSSARSARDVLDAFIDAATPAARAGVTVPAEDARQALHAALNSALYAADLAAGATR